MSRVSCTRDALRPAAKTRHVPLARECVAIFLIRACVRRTSEFVM